jgi:predicted ATPase with chaperone activity
MGGGQVPAPGDVSLPHHGLLCVDELPERKRHVLEVLRQPLERGSQEFHLPCVADLAALAGLAARLKGAMS